MQILFDTSVVLDVLLRREPWRAESSAVWRAVDDGRITGWLTASSLTDIFYIVRRSSDLKSAQGSVRMCLKRFEICTVDRQALEDAQALPGSDFEDNLQIACATRAELDAIITRDKDGFRGSVIRVFTPAELLT